MGALIWQATRCGVKAPVLPGQQQTAQLTALTAVPPHAAHQASMPLHSSSQSQAAHSTPRGL
jgi:hypothetical protein